MHDDGVYLIIIFFNIPFECNFSSDLNHSFITFVHHIVDGFVGSYIFTDVVGHESEDMISHSNEE